MSKLSTLRHVTLFMFNHSSISDKKYTQLLHPLIALLSTGTIYMSGCIISDDQQQIEFQESLPTRLFIGFLFIAYIILMIIARFPEAKTTVFYEMMWACNLSLLSSAYAFFTNKPQLLAASMILISIDQVLWYIDLIGYILFRVFPIGVAKYLTWPNTSKLRLMTSFHHIIYLPIGLYYLRHYPQIPFKSYSMSFLMSFLLAICSRILAPVSIKSEKFKEEIYLNLNISHELWKDVPFKILKICDGKPWYFALPFLSFMWNSGNYLLGYKLLNFIKLII